MNKQNDFSSSTELFQLPKIYSSNEKNNYNLIPSNFREFIDFSTWNSYSPIRQSSYLHILENPNTFFYRNRPPGDKEKSGPFSSEEAKIFFERLHYFRDVLHITDRYWGFFAVPIEGRLGYQCSNFYRSKILKGEIHDPHYKVQPNGNLIYTGLMNEPSQEVMKILEEEVFNYITSCADRLQKGHIPLSIKNSYHTKAVSKISNSTKSPKSKVHDPELLSNSLESEQFKNEISDDNKSDSSPSAYLKKKKKNARNPVTKSDQYTDLDSFIKSLSKSNQKSYKKKKSAEKDALFIKNHMDIKENKQEVEEEDVTHFFMLDPLTQEPMKYPYIDPISRIVMDLSTWKLVFNNEISNPYKVYAECKEDLIPMFKGKPIIMD